MGSLTITIVIDAIFNHNDFTFIHSFYTKLLKCNGYYTCRHFHFRIYATGLEVLL